MIRINLLDSITERRLGTAVAVERKVSTPESRLLMIALAVTGLLLAVIAWDIISTQMAKAEAERELARQQEIAKQLESVMKEQQELERKIANIDTRIAAIKRLRASQAGPSAVLEALRERIAMNPGIYLESVEQKGAQLTIKGDSPDENAVTQFGRSLEFSSGLFSNLNIETQRKDIATGGGPVATPTGGGGVVAFTIKCGYTPQNAKQASLPNSTTATTTTPTTVTTTTTTAPQTVTKQVTAPVANAAAQKNTAIQQTLTNQQQNTQNSANR